MAFDAFLKLPGIPGESEDSKHSKEIELLSYTFGATQAGTAAIGGGLGAGKVQPVDLTIVKYVDLASPLLYSYCCSGQALATGTLTVRKAGTSQQEYLKIDMSDIIITSVQQGGTTSSGSVGSGQSSSGAAAPSDIPTETISLNYTQLSQTYAPQKSDGTLGGTVKKGYNFKKNTAV